MRILALATLFLIGCSSFPKQDPINFSFLRVKQLKVGITAKSEVADYFGKPNEITYRKEQETWTYISQSSGYQRLTITFAPSSLLQSIVWIPLPSEDEVQLEKIVTHFPNANFKKIPSPDNNPHSISSMVSYVDEKMGINVVFQKGRDVVEAVIWTGSAREPATFDELKSVPYTIDKM